MLPFQIMIIPPEAPTEGTKRNFVNFFGQNFSHIASQNAPFLSLADK
jgi:hypothetical protein